LSGLLNCVGLVGGVGWVGGSGCNGVASCGCDTLVSSGTLVGSTLVSSCIVSVVSSCIVSLSLTFQSLVRIVNNLSFDWDVFISNLLLRHLNVLNSLFRDILRDVLSKILDCIIVSDSDFPWDGLHLSFLSVFNLFHFFGDSLNLSLVLVVYNLLLKRHIFNSALSLDHICSSVHIGSHQMRVSSHKMRIIPHKMSVSTCIVEGVGGVVVSCGCGGVSSES